MSDTSSGNYRWNLLAGTSMLASMVVASINLVLPWLLSSLGASYAVAVLIIPFARSGELAGNYFMAGVIGQSKRAKWIAMGSLIFSAVFLFLFIPAMFIPSLPLTIAVFMSLAIGIGLTHGVNILATQVIIAKTISHDRQGHLLSVRELLAGLVALLVYLMHIGSGGIWGVQSGHEPRIAVAAGLMILAGLAISLVDEPASKAPPTPRGSTKIPWKLLSENAPIRRFVFLRIFARPTYLLVPFLVLHISPLIGHEHAISLFVIATIIGTIVGSTIASRFTDSRLRALVQSGPMLSFVVVAWVFLVEQFSLPQTLYMYAAGFLAASAATKILGVGIDTFLIKLVPKEQVAAIAGLSRFIVVGVTMAFAGALGLLAQGLNTYVSLAVMAALQLICLWMAWRSLADLSGHADDHPADDTDIRFGSEHQSPADCPWLMQALGSVGIKLPADTESQLNGGCHSRVLLHRDVVIKWISGEPSLGEKAGLLFKAILRRKGDRRLQLLRSFMAEASFYRNFRQHMHGLRAPESFYVHSDPWRQRFATVMEMVPQSAVETGEPNGFSEETAALCLRRLGEFHASFWSQSAPGTQGSFWWGSLKRDDKLRFQACMTLTEERFTLAAGIIPPMPRQRLQEILDQVDSLPDRTIVHGDFKITNLFPDREPSEGRREVRAIDWQWFGNGSPAADSVFFVMTSLDSALMEKKKVKALVRDHHHASLVHYGIQDYSFAEMWNEWMWLAVDFLLYVVTCKWQHMTPGDVAANQAEGKDGLHLRSVKHMGQIIQLSAGIIDDLDLNSSEHHPSGSPQGANP